MAATPMMRQYEEARRACPDAILLFRMGDFYEMFHEDAKTAARVLNLALTSREKGAGAIPMAGFPHHQLESYLGKLIAAGFRAAVCEQVEDPKLAKGLVRREVTRVVTPGTVTDDAADAQAIRGGCCGTTPEFVRQVAEQLKCMMSEVAERAEYENLVEAMDLVAIVQARARAILANGSP
jgi:DNA mismatch repair ATPase MutS